MKYGEVCLTCTVTCCFTFMDWFIMFSCGFSCRETANELWKWMRQLEAEKFELQYRYMCQKYEVRLPHSAVL